MCFKHIFKKIKLALKVQVLLQFLYVLRLLNLHGITRFTVEFFTSF